MTISEILQATELSALDAELLISHALGKTREWLITHGDEQVPPEALATWQALEQRRALHEPVAYLIGTKEFYGRSFTVTSDVLIPRPATEGLVETALHLISTGEETSSEVDTDVTVGAVPLGDVQNTTTIVDIGTGSGCVAITLKLEQPTLRVLASDTSEPALEVAKQNAKALQADIDFHQADGVEIFKKIDTPFMVVSNPPYIPKHENLPASVAGFEPHTALFSGENGLDLIQRIVEAALKNPLCTGLCLECKTNQWREVEKWVQCSRG